MLLPVHIGTAQAAGDHASDMTARLKQRHRAPGPPCGDRGHHARGRPAIHDDVEALCGGKKHRRQQEQNTTHSKINP